MSFRIPNLLSMKRYGAWQAAVAVGAMALAACGGYGSGNNVAAPPPSLTLEALPTSVRLGDSTKLTWSATTGAACTASGGWSGSQVATGEFQATPVALGSAVFTLTCKTPANRTYGIDSVDTFKSVTVNVAPPNVFSNTGLVANTASALVLDARLVNPWGVAFGPTTTAWVANNRSNTATLYNGNGKPQPTASPRIVAMPLTATGAAFQPTGIVFSGGTDFVVRNATISAPARFIFVGLGGSLAGWSPTVDANNAIRVFGDPEAVYTGLAIAKNGDSNFLYAADFHNGRVVAFDANFNKVPSTATQFTFADPDLPLGFAPFGIQTLNTGTGGAPQIYVAYAFRSAANNQSLVTGDGLGVVDVYDTNGQLLKQLVLSGQVLNAPWGMAVAPAEFGALSGRLLIANFGDGRINAFSANTGIFFAALSDSRHTPFAAPGLWGIAFGNDVNNQPKNALFYAAGVSSEANGIFGRLDLGATPPLLNQPPVVTISAPVAGNVSAVVAVTASLQSSLAIAKVEYFADAISIGSASAAPFSIQWNTATLSNRVALLTAKATDTDGNVGVSMPVSVTIANAAGG